MNPIYVLILSSLLLLQNPRFVQSISLSRLCGRFGHSCYGANWGKRDLTRSHSFTMKNNEDEILNSLSNFQKFRLLRKLFRQRLQELYEHE